MAQHSIIYEDLPEFLFKESRAYDDVRRELIQIVKTAKQHGFDGLSDVGYHHLSDFIENKLSKLKLIESTEEADINELADLVFTTTGHSCDSAQDAIDGAVKLVKALGLVREVLGADILEMFREAI